MAVWVHGCTAVWLHGCMAVWLYGSVVGVHAGTCGPNSQK